MGGTENGMVCRVDNVQNGNANQIVVKRRIKTMAPLQLGNVVKFVLRRTRDLTCINAKSLAPSVRRRA